MVAPRPVVARAVGPPGAAIAAVSPPAIGTLGAARPLSSTGPVLLDRPRWLSVMPVRPVAVPPWSLLRPVRVPEPPTGAGGPGSPVIAVRALGSRPPPAVTAVPAPPLRGAPPPAPGVPVRPPTIVPVRTSAMAVLRAIAAPSPAGASLATVLARALISGGRPLPTTPGSSAAWTPTTGGRLAAGATRAPARLVVPLTVGASSRVLRTPVHCHLPSLRVISPAGPVRGLANEL